MRADESIDNYVADLKHLVAGTGSSLVADGQASKCFVLIAKPLGITAAIALSLVKLVHHDHDLCNAISVTVWGISFRSVRPLGSLREIRVGRLPLLQLVVARRKEHPVPVSPSMHQPCL